MGEKKKIPIEEIKKIPHAILNRLIQKLRNKLRHDETMQRVFKQYGVDIEEIYLVPMAFAELEVSAKTDHGIIYYNYELLADGDFEEDYQYGIYEVTHWLQQTAGEKPTQSADDGNYLDNPYEQEGFQNQMEYAAKEFGEDKAEQYVDDLLKHHDIKGKKKKEEKKKELLKLVP